MAYTRDERRGQGRAQKARMAGEALLEEGQTRKDLTREQRQQVRDDAGVTHMGRNISQFYNKDGNLEDIGEDNNPYKVGLDDFDLSAAGGGSAKRKDILNVQDAIRLHKEGGHSAEELMEHYKGAVIAKGAQSWLEKKSGQEMGNPSNEGGGGDDGDSGGGGIPNPGDENGNPTTPAPSNGGDPGVGNVINQIQDNDNNQDNSNNSGTINTNIDNSQNAMMGMGSSYGDTDDFMTSFKKKYNFFE